MSFSKSDMNLNQLPSDSPTDHSLSQSMGHWFSWYIYCTTDKKKQMHISIRPTECTSVTLNPLFCRPFAATYIEIDRLCIFCVFGERGSYALEHPAARDRLQFCICVLECPFVYF